MRSLAIVLLAIPLFADDLDAIRATQRQLIALRSDNVDMKKAAPLLTLLHKQLLAWAAPRIANIGPYPELEAVSATLNAQLNQKKEIVSGDDEEHLGEIEVDLERPDGDGNWLTLVISAGVTCGYDTTTHLFEHIDGTWKLRHSIADKESAGIPFGFHRVSISQPDSRGRRFILAIGNTYGCASAWHQIRYRVVQLDGEEILRKEDTFYLGDDDASRSRFEPGGTLIEYLGNAIDTTMLIRTHVHRYRFDDTPKRIAPIALSPHDFVDEWLRSPWKAIAEWTQPRLESTHADLTKEHPYGDFEFEQRCKEFPDRWQVAIDLHDIGTRYFLIQEPSEFNYQMLDVSPKRQPGCPGKTPVRSERRSLFPEKKQL